MRVFIELEIQNDDLNWDNPEVRHDVLGGVAAMLPHNTLCETPEGENFVIVYSALHISDTGTVYSEASGS